LFRKSKLTDLKVYATIHESIISGVKLFKDPIDGYRYQGRIGKRVVFENGQSEINHSLHLSKKIIIAYDGVEEEFYNLLVTPRYVGDKMEHLRTREMLIVDFAHVRNLSYLLSKDSEEVRLKKDIFHHSNEFKFLAIGELHRKRPDTPYFKPEWGMIEEGDYCRRYED